jgi:hypothetical protein
MKVYFTVEELRVRWKRDDAKLIYNMLRRYHGELRTLRITRRLLIPVESVKKFEERMRVFTD